MDVFVAAYTEVSVNNDGYLEKSDVEKQVRPETVLITLMLANNETGVIFPIRAIGCWLKVLNKERKHRVWLHTDAAQAIGKMEVNVQELGVDYLSIVGHKSKGLEILPATQLFFCYRSSDPGSVHLAVVAQEEHNVEELHLVENKHVLWLDAQARISVTVSSSRDLEICGNIT
ncbi:hypothetical protein J6590_050743 [Homalodisca vitripennis]|nr:hypothetical protein J6590_050743 [Homalodisca vitripennis]